MQEWFVPFFAAKRPWIEALMYLKRIWVAQRSLKFWIWFVWESLLWPWWSATFSSSSKCGDQETHWAILEWPRSTLMKKRSEEKTHLFLLCHHIFHLFFQMKFTQMMALTFSSVCFCFCLPMGINIFTWVIPIRIIYPFDCFVLSLRFHLCPRSAQRGGESSLFSTTDLRIPESINVIAYIFLFVPFWTNPLIYILSNRNYRLAYLNLLTPKKWRRRREETLRRTSTFQQTPRVLKREEEEKISRQNFKRIELVPNAVL